MNSFENDCLYCFSAQKWTVHRSQFMLFKTFNLDSKKSKKFFFKFHYFSFSFKIKQIFHFNEFFHSKNIYIHLIMIVCVINQSFMDKIKIYLLLRILNCRFLNSVTLQSFLLKNCSKINN